MEYQLKSLALLIVKMLFAPVLIPTLNRFEHFKRCVESLSRCNYAEKTELFIALDYPLRENHWIGYTKIKDYINSIRGFKSVQIIERHENYGAIKNFYSSIDLLFNKFDRLIFTEDDNEFATNFLSFVNQGLTEYELRTDIFSVSGYNSPIKMPEYYAKDIYLRKGFTAWGVGIWKKKWFEVDWSMNEFNTFVDNKKSLKEFAKVAENSVPQLLTMRKTQEKLADGIIAVHLLNHKMHSLYPLKTRVRNHGHDGSGQNCKVNEKYANQELHKNNEDAIFPPDIKPDLRLLDYIQRQYRITFSVRLKSKIPKAFRMQLKKLINH